MTCQEGARSHAPSSPQTRSVSASPRRNTNSNSIAITMSAAGSGCSVDATGTSMWNTPTFTRLTCANSTCSANYSARLPMTPTTDAEIADSAPAQAWW